MVFNSFIFILIFLPVVILCYFFFNQISRLAGKIVLLIGSALFYLYGGWMFAVVTACSLLVNFLIGLSITKSEKRKKAFFVIGIITNILFLFAFKYTQPIFNSLFKIDLSFFSLIIPLGISYYTFQQISFLANTYKGKIEKFNPLDYFIYILFFPKVMMGPLMEYNVFVEQLNSEERRSFRADHLLQGIKLFAFGLFKKVILADTFALAVQYGFANVENLYFIDVGIVMLSYTFQIYFDFSGYSDMAVGVALMLNFDLPQNFDSPYKAFSPRDFWKRWHITLTTFLRNYIYIPLGGNRKGKIITCLNVMVVFLISGIWHGANLTFLLWGAIWGLLCVIDRFIPQPKKLVTKIIGVCITFVITNLLWLLFRADSISQWVQLVGKLFTINNFSFSRELTGQLFIPMFKFVSSIIPLGSTYWALIMIILGFVICFALPNLYEKKEKVNYFYMIVSGLLIAICLFNLTQSGTFVYFGF